MNSAPSRIKSAATDTSVEMRNSAECTALRAKIVNSAATSAATANTQKKTAAQPERTIVFSFRFSVFSFQRSASVLRLKPENRKLKTVLRFVLDRLASLLQHLVIPDAAGGRVAVVSKVLLSFDPGRWA